MIFLCDNTQWVDKDKYSDGHHIKWENVFNVNIVFGLKSPGPRFFKIRIKNYKFNNVFGWIHFYFAILTHLKLI